MKILAAVLALAACAAAAQAPAREVPQIGQESKDSVWVPTPERLVRRMLQLADTTKDDVVVDLGAGDGRIPIYAAKHFGARAVAVELEANLVRVARESARAQGVAHLVRVLQQDLFDADLSSATVVALYISPSVMTRLKPRLFGLKPGTRIVSHHFTLDGWEPDEVIRTEDRNGYLWVVPADVRGAWRLRYAGEEMVLQLEQDHQVVRGKAARAASAVIVVGVRLRGTGIAFTAFDGDGSARHFTGRVQGDVMSGTSEGMGIAPQDWTAVRTR